jgi:hypothetical protein
MTEREVAAYYDAKGVLDDLVGEPVRVDLDEDLRTAILSGRRHRETKSITIRMDPYQVQALRRIATVKSIPYQTLIRHWVAMHIKEELGDAAA